MNGTAPLGSPARRVRVVTLIDILSMSGGAERLALLAATRLDPERFDSTLSVSRWPPPSEGIGGEPARRALELVEQSNARFLPLGHSKKAEIAPWVKLGRFLRAERTDVLHAHKFGSNVWGSLVGTLARVPLVLAHEHTWSYEGQPLRRFLDRELIARGADRFIAVSQADRGRMTEVEGIDPSRTMVIAHGILDPPPAAGKDVRAELGIAADAPVVGAVGVLRPQKAISVLLRAALLLREQYPRLRVLIAGDGFEQAELEALSRELGLADVVSFLGHRGDVPDLLASLDVAVSSSDFEGSPLAVMEYMAAGLPIAATDVGGVPDLIDSGVHGLLVPRRDAVALAGAIGQLLENPERAREMGARARERRAAEFTIDAFVGRLEELYLKLLADKGRA